MRIEFDVTGADRKALVTAMGEILEVKPKYLGTPTAAYAVDCFYISKSGAVEFDDRADSKEIENLLERLAERGFSVQRQEVVADDSKEADIVPHGETARLTVAIPLEAVNIDNLKKLLKAKGRLTKKALGIDRLPVKADNEKISFPWFSEADGDTARAYTHFISALCKMSREQKRITATEKVIDNEKYAFRCFLIRLGFIGNQYKTDRKILLKNLKGSSAFKNGARREINTNEISK